MSNQSRTNEGFARSYVQDLVLAALVRDYVKAHGGVQKAGDIILRRLVDDNTLDTEDIIDRDFEFSDSETSGDPTIAQEVMIYLNSCTQE